MMLIYTLTLFLATLTSTHPLETTVSRSPEVTVTNGTYYGSYNSHYNTEHFLGMPFAKPPVGDLRFRVPHPLDSRWEGARRATEYGAFCYGYGGDTYTQAAQGSPVSEDCLTLNVVRPAGIKGSLPVVVWIYGGGLYMGSSADQRYNLTFIVNESVAAQSPIVAVSLNYRLAGWGFMNSEELQESGQTLLGFRDQRLALHWIQENIEAFGGDPSKVTIWGESSGSVSVASQLLAYNGRDDKLFVHAIGESGAPARVDHPYGTLRYWQPYYDSIAEAVGCKTSRNSLQCIRTVPAEALSAAINASDQAGAQWGPYLDGDFIQTPASVQLQKGLFVKVPYMLGNNADEGTTFGPHGINTTDELINYLEKVQNFDKGTSQILSYLYPDIPSIGIPGTWDGRSYASAEFGLQYKRSSAMVGDIQEHAPRRLAALSWAAHNVPFFSFYFDILVNGVPYTTGSTHFQEVPFVFYNIEGVGYSAFGEENPLGGVLRPRYLALAKIMARMWISFVNTGNPNSLHGVQVEHFPRYTPEQPLQYVFSANTSCHAEIDSYRAEGMNFLMDLAIARAASNCTGLEACGASEGIINGNTDGPPPLLHY